MMELGRLCVILGSAREGRFCDTVAGWVGRELQSRDIPYKVLDPADGATQEHRNSAIGEADSFIVVTPEYNHSFAAPLKALIDGAHSQWEAKPVAFVSYGGISGGLRAVEHLRRVFDELHVVGIRDQVSFAQVKAVFDEAGSPRDRETSGRAFTTMIDRLAWWSQLLADGKERLRRRTKIIESSGYNKEPKIDRSPSWT